MCPPDRALRPWVTEDVIALYSLVVYPSFKIKALRKPVIH
jgi:hypothetical protein